jgi:hypothetical protein
MAWSGQSPEHDADHGKTNEGCGGSGIALEVTRQASVAADPGKRAFNDPALGQYDKSFGLIRALDDLRFDVGQDFVQRVVELPSLIGCVGKQGLQEGIHPEQSCQQQSAAVAILDVGRMNDGVQQQTQRVYQNVALLALDLLARIIAMQIDADPPFSALFTLWLSMMAAVGLASRSACSRHST